ncbi:unnamed protein product [Trichobilharzia szidati]|nr:unnamed protein product [Trichobilharzia szidati]
MAYSPGDKIFAKVKGHPHWPSRINLLPEDVQIPKGKYPIFFYGTHEVYFLAPKDIFPYEKFKHKYGVPRNKAVFREGLREIEEDPDVLLYKKDPAAETFLSRFYSFKRECEDTNQVSLQTPVVTETPSKKRSKPTSAEKEHSRPAKRRHTEPLKETAPVNNRSRSSLTTKSSLKKSGRLSSSTSVDDVKSPVQSVARQPEQQASTDSPRVSSLRLRIRKNSTGLKFSPDYISHSSPSTPGSAVTLEARNVEPEQPQSPSSDGLKIIIRHNTALSPFVSTDEKTKARPIVSVTPTPNTTSVSSVNQAKVNRPRSTAVVTPLLRNVLPELSDDSSDSGVSKTVENSKTYSTGKKGKQQSIIEDENAKNSQDSDHSIQPRTSIRLRKKYLKRRRESSDFIFFDGNDSRKASPATSPRLSSKNWQKNTVVGLNSKSADVTTSSIRGSNSVDDTKHRIMSTPRNILCGSNDEDIKDKEQQLKDLDTEERLLLIDRSIKSSLVQGHEDIATCVDRLEFLDKMAVSLPIMARCWTVVETIRKCRRYKRSLEVKIAAQKVFNKFLQLYATADKHELDLAHAELVKHQQHHVKKHSAGLMNKYDASEDTESTSVVPPYTGPKTMADLFQLTSRPTKDIVHTNNSNGSSSKIIHSETVKSNSETLQSPSSVDATPNSSQANERYDVSMTVTSSSSSTSVPIINRDSETVVSTMYKSQSPLIPSSKEVNNQSDVCIRDIPLPEEAPASSTHSQQSTKSPTDVANDSIDLSTIDDMNDFDIVDEYEEQKEPSDPIQKVDATSPTRHTSSESDNFLKTNNISQPIPSRLNVFTTRTPIPDCGQSTVYSGVHPPPPRPLVTNNPQYPYPVFQGVKMQTTQGSHNNLLPKFISSFNPYFRTNLEATPPQCSSRAYIPHSLHPSEDSPPLYKPYVPTRCDPDMILKAATDIPHFRHVTNNGSVTETSSSNRHLHSVSDCRNIPDMLNNISRETRTPPHGGRSPHALPHPLEHYQRYLNSALTTEDEANKGDASQQSSNNQLSSDNVDTKSDKVNIQSSSSVNDNSGEEIPYVPSCTEDLDTRIARIYDLAMRSKSKSQEAFCNNKSNAQKSTPNPIISPPPPPPPLPTSQRILFTHRPQHPHPNMPSFLTSPSAQYKVGMSSRSHHPDNGNLEYRPRHLGSPSRIFQDNFGLPRFATSSPRHRPNSDPIAIGNNMLPEIPFNDPSHQQMRMSSLPDPGIRYPGHTAEFMHPSMNSFPRRPFVTHQHHPLDPRRHCSIPPTHPKFPHPNSNRGNINEPPYSGRRRSGRDDDRDIYSMLGV